MCVENQYLKSVGPCLNHQSCNLLTKWKSECLHGVNFVWLHLFRELNKENLTYSFNSYVQNSILPQCQKRGPTFSRTVTKIQRSPVRVSGRWCWSGMAASSNWSGFTPWSSLQFLLHWVFCTGTFSSTMKSSERFLNLFASIVQGEYFMRHSEIEWTNVTYIIK